MLFCALTDGPSTPVFKIGTSVVSSLGSIDVINGTSSSVECISDGKPEPYYNWSLPDGSTKHGQILNLTTFVTGAKYTCNVSNLLRPSLGNDERMSTSAYFYAKVLCKKSDTFFLSLTVALLVSSAPCNY